MKKNHFTKKAFTLIELPVVRKRAFTLIELLVVVAIIGILATVVVINLSGAQSKSRDAKRANDIKAIDTALKLFFQDEGKYPIVSGCATTSSTLNYYARSECTSDDWMPGLVPKYLSALPKDPGPAKALTGYGPWGGPTTDITGHTSTSARAYLYLGDSINQKSYKIMAHWPENPTNPTYKGIWDPARDGNHPGSRLVDGTILNDQYFIDNPAFKRCIDTVIDCDQPWAWAYYSK
jgi:prepilin-type N-terminal cleavage/methylation domain-containing protein